MTVIELGGIFVKLIDIRGFFFLNGEYEVLLANGYRLKATSESVREARKKLRESTTEIVKKDKRRMHAQKAI